MPIRYQYEALPVNLRTKMHLEVYETNSGGIVVLDHVNKEAGEDMESSYWTPEGRIQPSFAETIRLIRTGNLFSDGDSDSDSPEELASARYEYYKDMAANAVDDEFPVIASYIHEAGQAVSDGPSAYDMSMGTAGNIYCQIEFVDGRPVDPDTREPL